MYCVCCSASVLSVLVFANNHQWRVEGSWQQNMWRNKYILFEWTRGGEPGSRILGMGVKCLHLEWMGSEERRQSVPRQLSWPFCCRDSCVKAWIYLALRFEDCSHWTKSSLKKPVPVWCWVGFSSVVNFAYPGYGYMAAFVHLSTTSISNCPSAGLRNLVLRISRLLPLAVPSPTMSEHNRSSVACSCIRGLLKPMLGMVIAFGEWFSNLLFTVLQW